MRAYSYEEFRQALQEELGGLKSIKFSREYQSPLDGVREGQRNNELFRYGCQLRRKGLEQTETFLLVQAAARKCQPPFPDSEAVTVVQSAYRYVEEQESSNGTVAPLKAVTLKELLDIKIEQKEDILTPLFKAQSLNMVFAKPGVGKTFFALNLAYAVASGGEFLGWEAQKPRRVLFIDGEMPLWSMQERVHSIARANPSDLASVNLSFLTPDLQESGMPDLATPEGQRSIEDLAEGADLIVVDNLSCLITGEGSENDAESWIPAQRWGLRKRSQGKCVLFIHHAGKRGTQRGTSKKEDNLDTMIVLKHPDDFDPSEGARFEIEFSKARHLTGDELKSFEAHLRIENEKQIWSKSALAPQSNFERVIEMTNDGCSRAEIMSETGLSKSTVSKHVSKARAQGRIKLDASLLSKDE